MIQISNSKTISNALHLMCLNEEGSIASGSESKEIDWGKSGSFHVGGFPFQNHVWILSFCILLKEKSKNMHWSSCSCRPFHLLVSSIYCLVLLCH